MCRWVNGCSVPGMWVQLQSGHRSVAMDEGICWNSPSSMGLETLESWSKAGCCFGSLILSCQERHPAGFLQVGIGGSSMHKNFWTQMPWLQSLVQTKGIFVSLCLFAQLWVSSAQTLRVAFGSGQILLFGDLFCFFLMLCKSTITTYSKEKTCGEDNENQIHGCQIKRWKDKTF